MTYRLTRYFPASRSALKRSVFASKVRKSAAVFADENALARSNSPRGDAPRVLQPSPAGFLGAFGRASKAGLMPCNELSRIARPNRWAHVAAYDSAVSRTSKVFLGQSPLPGGSTSKPVPSKRTSTTFSMAFILRTRCTTKTPQQSRLKNRMLGRSARRLNRVQEAGLDLKLGDRCYWDAIRWSSQVAKHRNFWKSSLALAYALSFWQAGARLNPQSPPPTQSVGSDVCILRALNQQRKQTSSFLWEKRSGLTLTKPVPLHPCASDEENGNTATIWPFSSTISKISSFDGSPLIALSTSISRAATKASALANSTDGKSNPSSSSSKEEPLRT